MAASPHQIAGAVLEEVMLELLRVSGFATVESLAGDPTIDPLAPAVTIRGRGADHQIDAVADPLVGFPFLNPTRLLVEGKAYAQSRRVGLDIIRNAVGTVKDLREHWVPMADSVVGGPRYDYRYAVFSTSEFTKPAQRYAYAQDVYLLPLRRSRFLRPVVEAIERLRDWFQASGDRGMNGLPLDQYRRHIRRTIREQEAPRDKPEIGLAEAVRQVRFGLIATAARQFPILLVPKDPAVVKNLEPVEIVRILWDSEGWYLRRPNGQDLFSFDLPEELFNFYASSGVLPAPQALQLKQLHLSQLQAFVVRDGTVRLVQFRLDNDWIAKLQKR